ncbi:hypothetical protein HYW19_01095 [Candidatus Woesearchaeota archaeon]|nr:hypothetical protein [Candidatus Woesearchaeota archaeon]
MNIRSQAALEFLTTYAWAFLVIIIMVGALAYFGVLNPSKLLPDRCNFGPEIGCNKDLLVVDNVNAGVDPPVAGGDTDNVLTIRLENNAGAPISVTKVSGTTEVTGLGKCYAFLTNAAGSETAPSTATPTPWGNDETRTLVVECVAGSVLTPTEKIKFNIYIEYYPSLATNTFKKTVFGEVFTTIQ